MKTYKNIRIKGQVSVSPVVQNDVPFSSVWILLMGLTGVGKSSFVQAFTQHEDLGIAKNTLESVTHDVVAYRLLNVTYNGAPISLIDTPGLSDVKISEMRIVRMIQTWMDSNHLSGVNRMLYFDRITDIRMAGSKGRCSEIFKSLAGENAASAATVVTTMWDQVANELMGQRMNDRYEQLQDDGYWKQFLDKGAGIVKFMNTEESALDVLDDCLSRGGRVWFDFETMIQRNKNMRDTLLGKNLHRHVRERLEVLQQKFRTIEDNLNDPSTKADTELQTFLAKDKAETENNLQEVSRDLREFEEGGEDDEDNSRAYSASDDGSSHDGDGSSDSRPSTVRSGSNKIRKFFRRIKVIFCCSS